MARRYRGGLQQKGMGFMSNVRDVTLVTSGRRMAMPLPSKMQDIGSLKARV